MAHATTLHLCRRHADSALRIMRYILPPYISVPASSLTGFLPENSQSAMRGTWVRASTQLSSSDTAITMKRSRT